MRIPIQKIIVVIILSLTVSLPNAQAAPGNPDVEFGFQGLVLTDIHDILTGASGSSEAIAVAIHPPGDPNAGKIVAVGHNDGVTVDFALARYNPDGSLDPSFGTNGVV